jgi:hypothetical protein
MHGHVFYTRMTETASRKGSWGQLVPSNACSAGQGRGSRDPATIQVIEIRRGRINSIISSCHVRVSFILSEQGGCGSSHAAARPNPLPLSAHVPQCWIFITINGWGSCTACATVIHAHTRSHAPVSPRPCPCLWLCRLLAVLPSAFCCCRTSSVASAWMHGRGGCERIWNL